MGRIPKPSIDLDLPEVPGFNLKKVILTALIPVLALGALSQVRFVREDEYMVVRSWTGAVRRIVTEAGPTVKIPLLESFQSLPKERKIYGGAPRDILTADSKPLIVDHYTVWQITDPWEFVRNTQSVVYAEQRIDAAIYSTVRAVMGTLKYEEIIADGLPLNKDEDSEGEEGSTPAKTVVTGRDVLNKQVTQLVNDSLQKGNYGITVFDVRLKRTDLPDQNLQSVYNRMKSDRAKIAADYTSQGEEQYIKIKAETDREAAMILAEAKRQAKEIEAEGEAEAARIYNEAYGRNPEFYQMWRTLESYKTTLKGKPTIIIPIDSPYAQLLQGKP